MLVWAGNVVAARWAPGQVSPQALTTLRWLFPSLILAVIARRHVLADRVVLRRAWPRILVMGAIGYTVYASLFYAAGAHTSAVNIALLQGAIPILVLLLNFLAYRQPVSWGQGLGVGVTLLGVAVAWSSVQNCALDAKKPPTEAVALEKVDIMKSTWSVTPHCIE